MSWSQYNKNLKERGSLLFWLPDDIEDWWYSKNNNGVGRPNIYSDKAIRICLQLRSLLRFPLRATEGFVESLFKRFKLKLSAPCYTQISRRTGNLEKFEILIPKGANVNIAVDSTGLKVYGEGEWKVRMHGISKRRTWRKVHLVVDVENHKILANSLTTNKVSDARAWTDIASKFQDKVKTVFGDGAYDKRECYESIRRIGANPIIPPQNNARMQKKLINPAKIPRDQAIAKIKLYGNNEEARTQWKTESNYHQRSLSETAMYRLKSAFGPKLQSRKFKNQIIELDVKVEMLNKMASLGMPKNM